MKKICCFLGHRTIEASQKLKIDLSRIVTKLITEENVGTFLFGSKSQFNDLCYKTVSNLKEIYPFIRRVYIRAEFPDIDDDYKDFLMQKYEDTYFPDCIYKSGKAVYVERNFLMIDKSDICVMYFKESYILQKNGMSKRKSGTGIAYEYAFKKGKKIINLSIEH